MLAKKANVKDNKIKVLMFGGPGTKKSLTALTFPKPLVLDLEKSTAHYGAINFIDFYRLEVDSRDKNIKNPIVALTNLINEINAGVYNDIVETLIIDPVTDLLDYYEIMLIKEYEIQLQKSTSRKNSISELNAIEKTKWYAFRKRKFKTLIQSILNINLNVVFIARHKLVWGNKNGQNMPIDETYDGHELLEYLVDVTCHCIKHNDDSINMTFKKSRLGNFNNYDIEVYDDMIDAIESEGKAQKYFSDRATKKLIERNTKERIDKETAKAKKEANKYLNINDINYINELSKSKISKYDNAELINYVLDTLKLSRNLGEVEKKHLPMIKNMINSCKNKKEKPVIEAKKKAEEKKKSEEAKKKVEENNKDNKTPDKKESETKKQINKNNPPDMKDRPKTKDF